MAAIISQAGHITASGEERDKNVLSSRWMISGVVWATYNTAYIIVVSVAPLLLATADSLLPMPQAPPLGHSYSRFRSAAFLLIGLGAATQSCTVASLQWQFACRRC